MVRNLTITHFDFTNNNIPWRESDSLKILTVQYSDGLVETYVDQDDINECLHRLHMQIHQNMKALLGNSSQTVNQINIKLPPEPGRAPRMTKVPEDKILGNKND